MSGAGAPSWAGLPSLAWRSVTSSRDAKFGVKGTVLAQAYAPGGTRFLIEEVRSLDKERNWSATYRVRDAEQVTDDEVRAGKSSPVIFRSEDLCACLEFAQ